MLHDAKSSLWVRLRFDHLCSGEAMVETGTSGTRARTALGAGAVGVAVAHGQGTLSRALQGRPGEGTPRASRGALARARQRRGAAAAADRRQRHRRRRAPVHDPLSEPPARPDSGLAIGALRRRRICELHVQSPRGRARCRRRTRATSSPPARCRRAFTAGGTPPRTVASPPRTTVALALRQHGADGAVLQGGAGRRSPGAVAVDGVTVPGATVSAAGKPLEVDEHGRFRAAVPPLDGDSAVAVRLEPARGHVHYYVRRRPDEDEERTAPSSDCRSPWRRAGAGGWVTIRCRRWTLGSPVAEGRRAPAVQAVAVAQQASLARQAWLGQQERAAEQGGAALVEAPALVAQQVGVALVEPAALRAVQGGAAVAEPAALPARQAAAAARPSFVIPPRTRDTRISSVKRPSTGRPRAPPVSAAACVWSVSMTPRRTPG